jgi:hypothetical protein
MREPARHVERDRLPLGVVGREHDEGRRPVRDPGRSPDHDVALEGHHPVALDELEARLLGRDDRPVTLEA